MTVYFHIADTAATNIYVVGEQSGQYLNQGSAALETYSASNWTLGGYCITCTATGGPGDWRFTVPDGFNAGFATYTAYQMASAGVVATTDDEQGSGTFSYLGLTGTYMPLDTARAWVLDRARSANDPDHTRYLGTSGTDYSSIDRVILMATQDFAVRTQCTTRTDTVTLVEDDEIVDFSDIEGFRPDLVTDVHITESDDYSASDVCDSLSQVDNGSITRLRADQGTDSGVPEYIGWSSASEARVHPPPNADGTLDITWMPPATVFSPGASNPDNIALNIPVEMCYGVLEYAALLLQANELEVQERASRRETYERHVLVNAGRIASFGARSSVHPVERG